MRPCRSSAPQVSAASGELPAPTAGAGEMWKLASSFLDPPQSLGGTNDIDPKSAACFARVTFVKGDNCIGLPLHGRLRNQFVTGVKKLRAPTEERFHRV